MGRGDTPQTRRSIVAQPESFVNLTRLQLLRLTVFLIALANAFGWHGSTVAWCQDTPPDAQGSALFLQAEERLGPESKLQWMELGDTSLMRWDPRQTIAYQGVVAEWDASKLVLVRRDATGPTTVPGDQVIGIEPGWKQEEFATVHKAFVLRQFSDVLRNGQSALKLQNVPRWQQRLLVSEMVQSASALGQWPVAGKVYGYLAQDDPPLLLKASIPLPWSDEALKAGKSMRDAAEEWIGSDNKLMQLLGASWLLGSDKNATAIETLKQLANEKTPMVAAYAKSQLWRTVLPSEIVSNHLASWIEQRDSMPLTMQPGPTMLLAHRLEQAGEWKLAVVEWLRIASLFGDRYDLKQRAVDRAVAACRNAGAPLEADRIQARFTQK